MRSWLFALGLLVLATVTPLTAGADACFDAAVAASKAESWRDFRTELDRNCGSDGAWAELQAEAVTRLLIQRWETLPELKALAAESPPLLSRILSLLDDTTSQDEASAIYARANTQCPTDCKELCAKIKERVAPTN